MSLTPKNWSEFQHYKDRAPAWIKLHRGLLDDFGFSRLPVASRALAPLLWLLASEYEDGCITCSLEEIAFRLRMTDKELRDALKPLIDGGFFASDSVVLAERKRDACLEKEREEEKRREDTVDDFEKFKGTYPKRGASNPWKPARELFERAIKSGHDPGMIILAAKAYSAECDRNKITATDKVAQAQTWLRQERFLDYAQAAGTAVVGYSLAAESHSRQWDAWRAHKIANGESVGFMDAQRERGGHWTVPSEWPPGHKPQEAA